MGKLVVYSTFSPLRCLSVTNIKGVPTKGFHKILNNEKWEREINQQLSHSGVFSVGKEEINQQSFPFWSLHRFFKFGIGNRKLINKLPYSAVLSVGKEEINQPSFHQSDVLRIFAYRKRIDTQKCTQNDLKHLSMIGLLRTNNLTDTENQKAI
jgi:hypothetical protein